MASRALFLVLKRKWYEMIDSGIKLEEYREITAYWIKRLCFTRIDNPFVYCVKEKCCCECFAEAGEDWCAFPFDTVTFQLGYAKNAPRMTFEVESIYVGTGKPEWGADPGKECFIIKLGKRL